MIWLCPVIYYTIGMNYLIITILLRAVAYNMPEENLWRAICTVESRNNPVAVGDGGKAVGIAQIHKCLVDDVNRIMGRKLYVYSDRLDPAKSKAMFWIYTRHYYPNGTPEQWARAWNGGPKGPNKKATESYWQKVQRVMDRECVGDVR